MSISCDGRVIIVNKGIDVVSTRFSVHVHATENERAVRTALDPLVGQVVDDRDPVIVLPLDGDAGNKIVVMTCTVKKRRELDRALSIIAAGLPVEHKRVLANHFDTFFSGEMNTLFFRLHKQAMNAGHFRLSQGDDIVHVAIKIAVYVRPKDDEEPASSAIKAFLLDRGIIA